MGTPVLIYGYTDEVSKRAEVTTMKVMLNGYEVSFEACVNMMDDEIREFLHEEGIETEQEFIDRYVEEHAKKYNGEEFTI